MKAILFNDTRRSTRKRLAKASSLALESLERRVLMSTTITGWSFDQLTVTTTPNLTPAPSTGTGTANSIGLQTSSGSATNYAYPNANASGTGDISDILNGTGNEANPSGYSGTPTKADRSSTGDTGTATNPVNPTGTNPAWRLRGSSDGWSSNAAIASQGAQFLTSTAGYNNISLSFDLDPSSASALSQVAVQYTTNGGMSWTEAPIITGGTVAYNGATDGNEILTNTSNTKIVSGEYIQLLDPANNDGLFWQNGFTATFPAAAAQDSGFGIRIVNGATGGGTSETELSGTAFPAAGAGNWRIDNVVISGTSAVGPTISPQPTNQSVTAPNTATFTTGASDNDGSMPTVQWYEGALGAGTAIPGATSTTLTIGNTNIGENGGMYYAVFTNPNSLITSSTNLVTLTVTANTAPVITVQPTAQTAAVNTTASFVAAAYGSPTPTVQWFSDTTGLNSGGNLIMGATNPAYPVTATSALSGTYYYAVFTNSVSSIATNAVQLTAVTTAHTITQWSFTQTHAPVVSSPSPSFGSGTLTPLGMANNYNNGTSVDDEDITNSGTTSTTDTGFNEDTWRVRGVASGGQNNGWSNAAPQYSQGAEVDVPVSNYDDLAFSFDWYSTTQGPRELQVQYFDPVTSTWTNAGGKFTATSDDYYGVSTNVNATTGTGTPTPVFVNLQGIADLAGISTLKLRMLTAYDSSLPNIDDGNVLDSDSHGQYASAAVYAVNEQQELNFENPAVGGSSAGPSSGTFTLTYNGQTTNSITYSPGDADLTSSVGSASAIASALNALPAIIEAGGVTVINPAAGMDADQNTVDDYTVIFNDPNNLPEQAITANTSGMNTGTTLTVQASTNGVVQYNNTSGNWRFDNITVTGDRTDNAPVIVTNPSNQTYTQGVSTSVTFNASAYSDTQSTDPITVTWEDAPPGSDPTNQANFTAISGEQNLPTTISGGNSTASLTLTSSSPALVNGELFEAVFSNSVGSATTTSATLSVVAAVAPTITQAPSNTSVLLGDTATFTAVETGGQPAPTVTWLENGNPVPLADVVSTSGTTTVTSTLVLTAGQADVNAQFEAVFSNAQGAYSPVTAGPATLTVLPPEAAIATWTFPNIENSTGTTPYNTPASTTEFAGASNYEGLGTPGAALTTVGFPSPGTTNVNDNPDDDVTSTSGTAETSFTENLWRVRNTASSSASAQGWDSTAPNDSQGIQLAVDTTGYSNVYMTFDWYSTTQGIRDMQKEYSLDGGTTWITLGSPLVATPNDYYGANQTEGISHIPVVFDLTGVTTGGANGTGANNNPNLELRLVSAYDPTALNSSGQPYEYTSATLSGGLPTPYNGTSGNWRFGNFSLDAIPEWLTPASAFNSTWNPGNNTLTVTGAATINADPTVNTTTDPTALPQIVASGATAALAINPADTGSPTDIHLAGLSLSGGATVTATSLGTARTLTDYHLLVLGTPGATVAPTFNIDPNSTLDLADNDMAILYGSGTSPLTTVQQKITSAYASGAWSSPGLTSSAAKTTSGAYALGYGEASTLGLSTFDGLTLGGNAVLVKYTRTGDLNLDGTVDQNDIALMAPNYGMSSGALWTQGDVNYDSSVDQNDLALISPNYGQSAYPPVMALIPAAKAAVAASPTTTTGATTGKQGTTTPTTPTPVTSPTTPPVTPPKTPLTPPKTPVILPTPTIAPPKTPVKPAKTPVKPALTSVKPKTMPSGSSKGSGH